MPAMSDGDEYGFSAAKLREILEKRTCTCRIIRLSDEWFLIERLSKKDGGLFDGVKHILYLCRQK